MNDMWFSRERDIASNSCFLLDLSPRQLLAQFGTHLPPLLGASSSLNTGWQVHRGDLLCPPAPLHVPIFHPSASQSHQFIIARETGLDLYIMCLSHCCRMSGAVSRERTSPVRSWPPSGCCAWCSCWPSGVKNHTMDVILLFYSVAIIILIWYLSTILIKVKILREQWLCE